MNKYTVLMIWSILLLLGFGCSGTQTRVEDTPASTTQNNPTDANLVSTAPAEPLSASTPIPIPDFAESIIFTAYGGGPGACAFEQSPAPSVIGGTLYGDTPPPPDSPGDFSGSSFPRGAQLCIAGIPENQPIAIKLTSPDQNVALTAEIKAIADPQDPDYFLKLLWTGYPESWNLQGGEHRIAGGGYRALEGQPSQVMVELWWPGSLAKGTWLAEVSWPGQTIHGNFEANTRNLPEIALHDVRAESQLLPNIDADAAYACHLSTQTELHRIVAENFQANSLIYVLIYAFPYSSDTKLHYRTTVHTDENGSAVVELPSDSLPGNRYFVFGVPEGVSTLTWNDGFKDHAFSFAAIANAMDCFVVPSVAPNAGVADVTVSPIDTVSASTATINARPTTYTLQAGEFAYCIARRFNVNPNELLLLNGLTRTQPLHAGRVLKIPQSDKPFPGDRSLRAHPTTHTVISSKETWGSIACLFGDVDPLAIASASGISPTASLFAGQHLNIP